MEFRYELGASVVTVQVGATGHGYAVTILRPNHEPVTYQIEATMPRSGRLIIGFGDRRVQAYVAQDGKRRYVGLGGRSWTLEPPQARGRSTEVGGGNLAAMMPGKVLDVLVAEGQQVETGDPLVILEAMKMELRITAPGAGVVARVYVVAGDVVDRGQRLVEMA